MSTAVAVASAAALPDAGRHGFWLARQPLAFRDAVEAAAVHRHFEKGEIVYRRGDPADGIFAVLAGCVLFYTGTEPCPAAALHASRVGAWFGEAAVIRRQPRMVTAVALEDSTLWHLPGAALDALLAAEPAHWRALADLAVVNIEVLTGLLAHRRFEQPEPRVAAQLLDFVTDDPPDRADPGVAIALTQQALAAMCGLSRNTVNRVLKGFEEAGVVELAYGRLRILDAVALARMVES